jgi:hypothetical protein
MTAALADADAVADVAEDVGDTSDVEDVSDSDDVSDADDAEDTPEDGSRGDGDTTDGPLELTYDFANGDEGWSAGVADYSPSMSDTIDFRSGIEPLPDEVAQDGETGFLLGGTNDSDDVAMFLTRQLGPEDGIEPNESYEISYRIVFASDAPSNCVGVGGAPGGSGF